jgi:hypothetical protein
LSIQHLFMPSSVTDRELVVSVGDP